MRDKYLQNWDEDSDEMKVFAISMLPGYQRDISKVFVIGEWYTNRYVNDLANFVWWFQISINSSQLNYGM